LEHITQQRRVFLDDVRKKRSPLWYELPLLLQIIGGIIAYFIIRKDDPKLARRCLVLGILLTIPLFVIYGGFMAALSTGKNHANA